VCWRVVACTFIPEELKHNFIYLLTGGLVDTYVEKGKWLTLVDTYVEKGKSWRDENHLKDKDK
jgi:hypothetical protein